MKAAMDVLLHRMIDGKANFRVMDHGGKSRLLKNLPVRLRGYANWQENWRVLVLVDRDQDDCLALKQKLETVAQAAHLPTKSRPDHSGHFRVVNRIVIEELEAWFFGDPAAVASAYPKTARMLTKAPYRDPDAITGGTWEALERVLLSTGHLAGGSRLPKIVVARAIATHMDPTRNHSPSFQAFRKGLDALLA